MARGVNKVIIIGNLGADPDIRYSASGTAVAKFNVATTERVPAGEGNWEDRTEWHRIVVFGKTAEHCGNYLSKGRQVYVEGSLRTNQWEDAQGVKRYTTEIVARDIQFLGSVDDQSRQSQGGGASYSKGGGQQSNMNRAATEELPPPSKTQDEDIPF
jgi:single-strand DNA-binding protein